MANLLVFDIETIPDVDGLRRLHGFSSDFSDELVIETAYQLQRSRTGRDFMPLYLQRIVAISCLLRSRYATGSSINIWSLGSLESSEGELVQRFFDGIEKYVPQLISWNGGGFDLPVLHYRAMVHGVSAPRYWDWGDGDYLDSRDFKWNNYLNRYHMRHLDLMDMLSMYQVRANAPLDQFSRVLGFPGKLGMDGSQVADTFYRGERLAIRQYCETDVLNTYLVYTRFRRMRGEITQQEEYDEWDLLRSFLTETEGNHWREYLAAWSVPVHPMAST